MNANELPKDLYVGRARVQEGKEESASGRPHAYAGDGISAGGLFRRQLLRQCAIWVYRDIYVLPWEVEA